MGLTKSSTGTGAVDSFSLDDKEKDGIVIALAGNPNVGKSTIFNSLTGMHQHTGNWPGKTVTGAKGEYTYKNKKITLVDLPGTYSLMAHSQEEEVARDFVCFGSHEGVVVVCDATCLERNLNLVLQTIEITNKTVVCINLIDEAKRKKIKIDKEKLEGLLGVPVVFTDGRKGTGLNELSSEIIKLENKEFRKTKPVIYDEEIENAINDITGKIEIKCDKKINPRWLAIKILEGDEMVIASAKKYLGIDIMEESFKDARAEASNIQEKTVTAIIKQAEKIAEETVEIKNEKYDERDRKIDKVLTGKWGYAVMLLMLMGIFWLTIVGSNYPSELLSSFLFKTEKWLYDGLLYINVPPFLCEMVARGVYRMLIWVVSVMLPPMAIFFPLFTLLEDLGYLPRVAFNLDKCFLKCSACGKQALTMWVRVLLCACKTLSYPYLFTRSYFL